MRDDLHHLVKKLNQSQLKHPPMERKAFYLNGVVIAVVEILIILLALGALVSTALLRLSLASNETTQGASLGTIPGFLLLVLALIMVRGFRMVHPDQALIVFSHRKYVGTIRGGGLIWTNPFVQRQRVSLQTHRSTVSLSETDAATASPLKAEITWNIKDTSKVSAGTEHYEIVIEAAAKKALLDLRTSDPATIDMNAFRAELQKQADTTGIEIQSVKVTR